MRFREILEGPDNQIELGRAALLVATLEYPEIDVERWLAKLDEIAGEVRARTSPVADDLGRLQAVTRYLFGELKLRGNSEDYYDSRNSFLNDVIERGLGIPISLAVLLIEIGRRAEVPLVGIGLPGHFLVRHAQHAEIFLDPFDGGRILTRGECAEIVSGILGDRLSFQQEMLRPVSSRQILARMHTNLRTIYLQRQDLRRVKKVISRLVQLEPEVTSHWRDRGVFRIHGGDARGIEDVEHYLSQSGEVSDREEMEKLLAEADRKLRVIH